MLLVQHGFVDQFGRDEPDYDHLPDCARGGGSRIDLLHPGEPVEPDGSASGQ